MVMVGPFFPEILSRNGGIFPSSTDEEIERSYACWYSAKNAHKAIHEIPAQVSFEGDTDATTNLRAVVEGACLAYGITDLNLVMPFMPLARRWAFMKGLGWDGRFQAWLDSAGQSWNEVTREPDKI